jgi:lysine-N-methylase
VPPVRFPISEYLLIASRPGRPSGCWIQNVKNSRPPCAAAGPLQPESPISPNYAEKFECIGSACEDTCCQGWNVPIDRGTYENYAQLPAGPLRTLIDETLFRCEEGSGHAEFARIRMTSSNRCPLLTETRLCRIQQELGKDFLSHTCATYPRIIHSIGEVRETALALSCPEAARLVLLNPALLETAQSFVGPVVPNSEWESGDDTRDIRSHFWTIRKTVLALIRNRTYPLWQRIFLLGVLCRRLDELAQGKLQQRVMALLADFDATVAAGSLRPTMTALPVDVETQLDVVLRLAGIMLHRSNVTPRFAACVQSFAAGIGNDQNATLAGAAARYAEAQKRYYAPFFHANPHILENYLTNIVIRRQFPFGRDGMRKDAQSAPLDTGMHLHQPSMSRELIQLVAQFTLMKGLLIGVAGAHRQNFSGEHVVHTVQAASKHFEHHPEFLDRIHALLVESRMDGMHGLAILVRESLSESEQVTSRHMPSAAFRSGDLGSSVFCESPSMFKT